MGGFIRCKQSYLLYLFHAFFSLASGLGFFYSQCLEKETKARRGQVLWAAPLLSFMAEPNAPEGHGDLAEEPIPMAFPWFCSSTRHVLLLQALTAFEQTGIQLSHLLGGVTQQKVTMSLLGHACGPRCASQTAPLHAPQLPWSYCHPVQDLHAANLLKWRPHLSLCDHCN